MTSDDIALKDSGARRDFGTGSVRDVRDGKGRYDLLPPRALFLVARQFEEGAKKYGERNWEKGQPLSVYIDSATRHIFNHLAGKTDERHDVAAAWNLLTFLETSELIKAGRLPNRLDDLPKYKDGSHSGMALDATDHRPNGTRTTSNRASSVEQSDSNSEARRISAHAPEIGSYLPVLKARAAEATTEQESRAASDLVTHGEDT